MRNGVANAIRRLFVPPLTVLVDKVAVSLCYLLQLASSHRLRRSASICNPERAPRLGVHALALGMQTHTQPCPLFFYYLRLPILAASSDWMRSVFGALVTLSIRDSLGHFRCLTENTKARAHSGASLILSLIVLA